MKRLISDSLTKGLTTLLLNIWAAAMFDFAVDARLHMGIISVVLMVWTAIIALLDTRTGPAAVALLTAGAVAVSAALLDGTAVISCFVALLTGGEPDPSFLVHAVVLMGMAVFSLAALYLLRGFWPRAVWCALWLGLWIWGAVLEWEIPKAALAAGGAVLLMTLTEGLHRGRRTMDEYSGLIRSATLLLAGVGAVLFLMPVSPEPYPYPILNAIVDKAEEIYDDMVTELLFREEGEGEFTINFSGYSEEGTLGEGVQASGQRSGILAKSVRNTDGSLYLFGNSWDTFDGSAWSVGISGDQEDLLDWNVDTAERIYALWRYQQSADTVGVTNYMRNASVYLQYEGVDTRTLFTAPNTIQISTDRERFPWDGLPGKTLFDYLQTRDTFYRVFYLEQNDARLGEIVESAEGYAYSAENDLAWLRIFGDYRPEFGLTLAVFDTHTEIEPVLARRQELIYDAYLGLPEDLSDEVCALAEEITAECGSDYEKLLAIAEYLQTHYTYTAEPAPIPADRPFLDYVLFEAEEGYCTWYATAAAVLARCAGIPARYVQGYCVELEASVQTVLDETHGHAWCEGYIPGFGWVTVEATPGFSTAGDGWESVADRGESEETVPEEEQEETAEEPAEKAVFAPGAPVLLGALLCPVLIAALIVLPRKWRSWRDYRAASWSEKTRLDLRQFLLEPVRRELRRRGDESLRGYLSRLRWMLRLDVEQVERWTILYEELLFNERELTEREWQESRTFLAELRRQRHRQKYTEN